MLETGRRAVLGGAAMLLGLAVGACATMPAGDALVSQRHVAVQTAEGSAHALLVLPAHGGRHPAVILWPDLTGLRPTFADMGHRLAQAGYVVLVPNAFYRSVELDGSAATAQPRLSFGETMKRGAPWRAAASDEAVVADAGAYVAFLDTLPQVDPASRVSMVGFDIGGAHAFVAARAMPDRIGAVAAIHPLAIATSRDTSPHLYVDQSKARYLVEIARPDDEREPGDKEDLRQAFARAGLEARVTVVDAPHGFMVPDDQGFDAATSERVWNELLAFLSGPNRE